MSPSPNRAVDVDQIGGSSSSGGVEPERGDYRQRIEGLFDLLRSPITYDAAAQAGASLAAGDQFADFEIDRPLGSGGMGEVFLARQISLDRQVALKICRTGGNSEAARRRFDGEGRALAQLRHPYVVPVIAQGVHNELLYLAMEYVAGPSLADVLAGLETAGPTSTAIEVIEALQAETPLRQPETTCAKGPARLDRRYITWAVHLLRKVADGLAAIHDAGLIHRDIKPANIIVSRSGDPKIVDFGLARMGVDPSTTRTGEFLGTPAYASPEQLRGQQDEVSASTDVYSLGVVLYESFCLQWPFRGHSAADVTKAILADDPPLLRRIAKSTPWELEAIADKCLSKTPSSRYVSAQALSDELSRYLELRPIVAKRATPPRQLLRAARRRPWRAASIVLLIVLSIVGGAGYSQARRVAAEQAQVQRQQQYEAAVAIGDAALFRLFVAERPTWMKSLLDRKRAEAINAYGEAIELSPQAVWPRMQRGRLYASQDETLQLALADFRHASLVEPTFSSPRTYIEFFEERVAGASKDDFPQVSADGATDANDLYWLGALNALTLRDKQSGSDCYSKCLVLAPDHYWARLERVLYGAETGVPGGLAMSSRIEQVRVAKTLRPDLPFASELLAWNYLRHTEPDQARAELDSLIASFGLNVLRAHTLADFEIDAGNLDAAREILLRVKPQDMEGGTAEKLGDVAARTGDLDAAIGWYEVAQQERVVDSSYRLERLAAAYAAAGRVEDADAAFRKAISINEEFPRSASFIEYAAWLEQQHRIDEAEDVYLKLDGLELPEDQTYAKFSEFLVRQGRTNGAISVLQRGIGRLQRAISDGADALEIGNWRNALHQLQAQLVKVFASTDHLEQAEQLLLELSVDIPYSHRQAQLLMDVLNGLERPEDALVIARMGELSRQLNFDPERITQVDLQLQKMGRDRERRLRSLIRRAHGVKLSARGYLDLAAATGNLQERFSFLDQANREHPESYLARAALALAERRRGNAQQCEIDLWLAVELYEAEVQNLILWSSLLPDAQPIDLFLRTFNAQSPHEFLQACFLAVEDRDAEGLANRLAQAVEEIGGDPDVVERERQNVREFVKNRSKQQ